MLQLARLNVNSLDIDNVELTWEWEPTDESLSDYRLSVYRSEAPSDDIDDYDELATNISPNTHSYIDTTLTNLNLPDRIWYYKLKIMNVVEWDFSIVPSFPAYFHQRPLNTDKAAKEIIRRKKLSLKKFVGRTFYLLKKRSWGTRCVNCWDETLFRTDNPNCTNCYGTGWTDGYFTPIPFLAMNNPDPKYSQILMFGEWKPSDVLLYSLNYPVITSRDVIVDDENKRWRVIQVRSVEKLGRTIEQNSQLALIASDDIIYNVPVDFSVEGDVSYV